MGFWDWGWVEWLGAVWHRFICWIRGHDWHYLHAFGIRFCDRCDTVERHGLPLWFAVQGVRGE